MKWFDKWFYSKARWAQKRGGIENPDWKHWEDILDKVAEHDRDYAPDRLVSTRDEPIGIDPHDLNDGLRIDVKRLNGGFVVTFRHTERTQSKQYVGEEVKKNSYIIREDEDFNDRLGKLLTMELLK